MNHPEDKLSEAELDGVVGGLTEKEMQEAFAAQMGRMSGTHDQMASLARVMIEQAAAQREHALDDRLAARDAAKHELLDQANKMKEAASHMQAGAMANTVNSVVASSMAMTGGVMGHGSAAHELKQQAAHDAKLDAVDHAPSKGAATSSDLMKHLDGAVKDVQDKLKQIEAAKNSAMRSMTRP